LLSFALGVSELKIKTGVSFVDGVLKERVNGGEGSKVVLYIGSG